MLIELIVLIAYPFLSTLITIKLCEKGIEMYRILEKWYLEHNDGKVNVNSKSTSDTIKEFYSRTHNIKNVDVIDDINNPMEIEDILKDDSIKSHGIIVIPDKEGLKKIIKFIKKRKGSKKKIVKGNGSLNTTLKT